MFGLLAFYLLFLAGFSTSVMNNEEQTYLIRDNMVTNLLFAVLFSEAVILLSGPVKRLTGKILRDKRSYLICKWVILLLFFGLELIFVISARKDQNFDSRFIFDAAAEWKNGVFGTMEPGGYVEAHDNNKGIVLFIYLLSYITGPYNYLAFQMINVIFLVLLYNSLVELGRLQGMSDVNAILMLLGCISFLPMDLYVVFTYGVIIGLSCMTNALLFSFRYLDTGKAYHGITAVISAFAGILIKQNGMILLLGILIILLIRIASRPDKKAAVLLFLPLLGVLILTKPLAKLTTDTVTKTETTGGIAMNAYVVMGLSENGYLYPGWYNVYVDDSYRAAGFSTERQHEESNRVIREKLEGFKNHPRHALDFFSKKNASQWNNPDFEAVWLLQYRGSYNPDYPRILEYLESADGADLVNRISNRIQFIILFGVVLFVFLKKDKTDPELYFCIVIIGGFVFHTIWEAKGQYILTYFIFMLPLAVSGFTEWIYLVKEARDKDKYKRSLILLGTVIVISVIIGTGLSKSLNSIFVRKEDTGRYMKYLEEQRKDAYLQQR